MRTHRRGRGRGGAKTRSRKRPPARSRPRSVPGRRRWSSPRPVTGSRRQTRPGTPRPTLRPPGAGRVPTHICGHRRRRQLGPLVGLSGSPGAAVHPAYIPGSPRHCDIRKLQRHHQQNVPKCQGSWSPAARPQKLCPGGQEPCKQQESHLPATHPAWGSRPRRKGRAPAPPPTGSSVEQQGSWPNGSCRPVLLCVGKRSPHRAPGGR